MQKEAYVSFLIRSYQWKAILQGQPTTIPS